MSKQLQRREPALSDEDRELFARVAEKTSDDLVSAFLTELAHPSDSDDIDEANS